MAIVDFDTGFWSDGDIQIAPPKAKLLHIYFWTNPRKNSIGIYEITLKTIRDDTGLDDDEIRDCLKYFGENVQYDFHNHIVLVLNHFRRQFMKTGVVSPKHIQAAAKNLLSLPVAHPFISAFLNYKYYKVLSIPYPYGLEGVSVGYEYLTGKGEVKVQGEVKVLEGGAGGDVDKLDGRDMTDDETVNPTAKMKIIAHEKSETAYRDFREVMDKYLQDGIRIVLTDPISRFVYQEIGGSTEIRKLISKNGDCLERSFRQCYERHEIAEYAKKPKGRDP